MKLWAHLQAIETEGAVVITGADVLIVALLVAEDVLVVALLVAVAARRLANAE